MEKIRKLDSTSWINPHFQNMELKDDHYELIIRCIQDFYWWSRKFHHQHSLPYKRIINVLEIPMDEIEKIMEK